MKQIFDNSFVLKVAWKWKIHLAIAGVVSIILAAIFSSPFFITPKFKSQGRLYPVNTNTYSEESESEQMLEVLNSYDIKRRMVETFNLAEQYKVKPDDPYFHTKILKKYEDHVDCKKTEYESVEIKVLDADPQIACNMVDSIISFYNQKVYSVRARRFREQAETYKRDYDLIHWTKR
jgi:capsular polysaccharide biosynthesis protein